MPNRPRRSAPIPPELEDAVPASRTFVREQLEELREALSQRPPRLLLTPDEFGVCIGVSGGKVYGLLRAGLPCVRIGAQRRIDAAEAVAWLKERGSEP